MHDEEYWKRCCKARWKLCDVKRHGGVWKRMYFERNLQEAIEGHAPVNQEEVPKEVCEGWDYWGWGYKLSVNCCNTAI